MTLIDTPLLILGGGPAAFVIAKTASGRGLPSLVVGAESTEDAAAVVLGSAALATLEPHGVLEVLRPYAVVQEPFTISPAMFEQALKHHCVADMLITVFDDMHYAPDPPDPVCDAPDHVCDAPDHVRTGVAETLTSSGSGVLSDDRSQWTIQADAVLDTADLENGLEDAIVAGAAAATAVVDRLTRNAD